MKNLQRKFLGAHNEDMFTVVMQSPLWGNEWLDWEYGVGLKALEMIKEDLRVQSRGSANLLETY